MAAARWADYSAGYPGGAALVAAGFTGIIAYIGIGSGPKLIRAADYHDAVAHGLQVLLCAELSIHDAEGGYPAGVTNAQKALADARSKGIPDSVGIAAVCDEHLTSAQISTCVDYVRGFRDVLGQSRTGAYGFAEFVDAVHAQGFASWWWKCGSAPTASEAQWVTFWQQNTGTQVVNRIQVDIDLQYNALNGVDMGFDLTTPLPDPASVKGTNTVQEALTVLLAGIAGKRNGGELENQIITLSAKVDDLLTAVGTPTAVTLSADQVTALGATVVSAVTAAVSGLSPTLSAAEVATIAKATADEFAARLAS